MQRRFYPLLALVFGPLFSSFAQAGTIECSLPKQVNIWDTHAIDFETGMLWKVGGDTTHNYRIIPFMLTWRSPEMLGLHFKNGAALTVRNKITGMANWFETGAENRYLGFSASPSVELWSPCQKWSLFVAAGGGFGWVDSSGVGGGQGQDFTLNWYVQSGVEHRLNDQLGVRLSGMFIHHSNGGATDPNPGLDAAGAVLSLSWQF